MSNDTENKKKKDKIKLLKFEEDNSRKIEQDKKVPTMYFKEDIA